MGWLVLNDEERQKGIRGKRASDDRTRIRRAVAPEDKDGRRGRGGVDRPGWVSLYKAIGMAFVRLILGIRCTNLRY